MRVFIFILFGIFLFSTPAQSLSQASQSSQDQTSPKLKNKNQQLWDKTLVTKAVDSIITIGIKEKAFPGAQVLVAKEGKILFHKAFGFHTYDSIQQVGLSDLYDLASVTKIIGPLPILMKLYEEGVLDLDKPFSTYWKPWRNLADKKDLTLREILAHQGGLKPYIVFVDKIMKANKLKRRYVRSTKSIRYQNQAYENLFIKNEFANTMYRRINKSPVANKKIYQYSGLAFLIFPKLISQLTGNSYEYYLQKHFYIPVGATELVYKPRTRYMPNPVVPTEIDTVFRKSVVNGWVHDENAALLGGISGNAGLFGTAKHLLKMMQLYQNYGVYEGRRYLAESTLREFTSIQYPENNNRRGLGFDRPLIKNEQLSIEDAYPAPEASQESFGHSGFTGTFVWVDPKYQMVYIFLSNRVYPYRSHRNLYELNVRTAVQQQFYKAFIKAESVN